MYTELNEFAMNIVFKQTPVTHDEKNFVNWITKQLELASDAVEYISWITAGILAVIAVLTIFLTHLFQNHTLEIRRLNEKLRDKIDQENLLEITHLLTDIEFVGQIHPVIKHSVKISKVALRILTPVWIVSGFSFSQNIIKVDEPFPFLGILLIAIGTGLFVYFTLNLTKIISKLEKDEGFDKYVTKKSEFSDVCLLKYKNFSLASVLKINELEFEVELFSTEPFAHMETSNKLLLTNLSIILNMQINDQKHFFMGKKLTDLQTTKIYWALPDSFCHSLRSKIKDAKTQKIDCYISFIVDQIVYSFDTTIDVVNEDEIQIIKIKLKDLLENNQYTLPLDIKSKLAIKEYVYQH